LGYFEIKGVRTMETHIYITDASGKRRWNTSVTYGQHHGEMRNMERRLALVRAGKFVGIDRATARIVTEAEQFTSDDAALLAELDA
jgi:hypothetical protein